MLKDVKAVIFDMDGTLVDSMWVWAAVDQEYIEKYGLKEPDNFHEEMEGMSFEEVAAYFLRIFPDIPLTLEELKGEWHRMTARKYEEEVGLKPGVKMFLDGLKSQGILTGIATSNSRELAEMVLKARGVREQFDCVLTSDEAKAGKPAPDVYLKAADLLKVHPKDCLVFEDVPKGILAGKNAGMKVCAVFDEASRGQEKRKRELADYYIRSFEDIKNNTYEVL